MYPGGIQSRALKYVPDYEATTEHTRLFSDDAPLAREFQEIFERLWEEGKPLKD